MNYLTIAMFAGILGLVGCLYSVASFCILAYAVLDAWSKGEFNFSNKFHGDMDGAGAGIDSSNPAQIVGIAFPIFMLLLMAFANFSIVKKSVEGSLHPLWQQAILYVKKRKGARCCWSGGFIDCVEVPGTRSDSSSDGAGPGRITSSTEEKKSVDVREAAEKTPSGGKSLKKILDADNQGRKKACCGGGAAWLSYRDLKYVQVEKDEFGNPVREIELRKRTVRQSVFEGELVVRAKQGGGADIVQGMRIDDDAAEVNGEDEEGAKETTAALYADDIPGKIVLEGIPSSTIFPGMSSREQKSGKGSPSSSEGRGDEEEREETKPLLADGGGGAGADDYHPSDALVPSNAPSKRNNLPPVSATPLEAHLATRKMTIPSQFLLFLIIIFETVVLGQLTLLLLELIPCVIVVWQLAFHGHRFEYVVAEKPPSEAASKKAEQDKNGGSNGSTEGGRAKGGKRTKGEHSPAIGRRDSSGANLGGA